MDHYQELREKGFTILPNYFDKGFVQRLIIDLDNWLDYAQKIRETNGVSEAMSGVAHQILGKDDTMAELICQLPCDALLKKYFDGPYILNSFSGIKNETAGNVKYDHAHQFHRDVRTYSSHLTLMINVIIMLEDFTISNGATRVLPYSHKNQDKPSDFHLEKNSQYLLGKAGSLVLFDSNLWHSASPNKDGSPRRALTLNYTRPFIKPQMNFCNLVGENFSTDPKVLEVIGFKSRVPNDHYDWYQPASKRFYHSDQG
jgi:hypothetical protein